MAAMTVSNPILPLGEQLQRKGTLSEQLVWLLRNRLLPASKLLYERGLIGAAINRGASSFSGDIGWLPEEQLVEERRVFSAFTTNGVRALALKGCLVGHLVYPDPRVRPRTDLDVLIPVYEREAARAVLRQLGYRRRMAVDEHEHAIQEQWNRRHKNGRIDMIDLHWDLRKQTLFHGLFPFESLWERSVVLPSLGVQARGVDPIHSLINAALHWFELQLDHMPQVWLLDIDLLWEQLDEAGQKELVDIAIGRNVAGLVGQCLANARTVFATEVTDDVLKHLQEAGRKEKATGLIKAGRTPLGYHWFEFQSTPGLSGKAGWLAKALFPPPENMRIRYPEGSRFGVAGLYARRFLARLVAWRRW